MSLEEGLKCLQLKDYARAVELLEEYCQQSANFHSPLYIQAKMALVRAYRSNNQRPQAIALALELENHLDQDVSQWAKRLLTIFSAEQKTIGIATNGVKFRSREKGLKPPKLGIIEDGQPLAFTYGSRRGNARLVVSRGLFTYLDDEEVATVYAHELGHIWQGDFALMTICASFDHLSCYLDSFAQNQGNNFKDTVFLALLSSIITIFRPIIVFCCLYLSRTREYFADHFAAQVTGNPNALARALVKIAFGLVQETAQSSPLLLSTNVLNIALEQDAIIAGNVYGIALESRRIGQSFLWDIYN